MMMTNAIEFVLTLALLVIGLSYVMKQAPDFYAEKAHRFTNGVGNGLLDREDAKESAHGNQ